MRSRKSLFFITLAAMLMAGPVLAAGISVAQPGLNGTGNKLQVDASAPGSQAVVISQHPSNETLFTMSFYVNTDTLNSCNANTCRIFVARTFGNATGPFVDTFRVALKGINNGASYRILVWYKTPGSPNPGTWEAINTFFLTAGGQTDTKVTVEYTANTGGPSTGSIRVFKDDVMTDDLQNLDLPNDIDNARIGMVSGNILAGATGNYDLDEYVSTRATAGP